MFNFLRGQRKAAEVRARRQDLKKIEDLGAILEEHLILDNRYTEHRYAACSKWLSQFFRGGLFSNRSRWLYSRTNHLIF